MTREHKEHDDWMVEQDMLAERKSAPAPSGPKLTIELVPSTCWFSNVRSCVTPAVWDEIRRECYRLAGHVCEICNGRGPKWPVECHEVWDYDDKKKTQTLVRMIALCPACHEVKHIGFASTRGRLGEATQHLAKVNGLTRHQADVYVQEAFGLWEDRSQEKWKLNLSYLDRKGIKYKTDRGTS